MKIALNRIRHNPHRDLTRNPLESTQVEQIKESISRTGFWDNVVVRECADGYQLAYGHNRLEALKLTGETEAEFIVKTLSDYDMLAAMIDENATQRNQTPRIIFENITAALKLAGEMFAECSTVEEFNERARVGRGAAQHHGQPTPSWRADEFIKAKECLESGEGLGRRFVKQFLPNHGEGIGDHTMQSAIDSYYAESRKAAAEKKAEEAEAEADELDQEAEADEKRAATAPTAKERTRASGAAKQKRVRAAKAKKEAEKAKAERDRMDYAGVDRDLLEQLPGIGYMNEVVKLIRTEKIPPDRHVEVVEVCLREGWVPGHGGPDDHRPTSIRNAGRAWWFRASGRAEKVRKEATREHLKWTHREKSLEEFVTQTAADVNIMIKALKAIAPFADQIENEKLVENFDTRLNDLVTAVTEVRRNLPRPENVVPIDLKRLGG